MELKAVEIPNVVSGSPVPPPERREISIQARPQAAAPPAKDVADPKAPAPSASSSGTPEAGKAATAPGTAEPAAGEKKAEGEAKPEEKADGKAFAALKRERQRTETAVAEAKPLIEKAEALRVAWAKGDVDTIIAALGIKGDQLVDLWVKKQGGEGTEATEDGEPKPPVAPSPEVLELRAKVEALEKRLGVTETTEQARTVDAATSANISKLGEALKGDTARWEMASKDPNAAGIAYNVMFEHWRNTGGEKGGEYLSFEQALDATEEFFINEEIKKAHPDLKARRALLGGLKPQSGEKDPAASPAETGVGDGKDGVTERVRQAFTGKRVTVTNTAASAAPTTATRTTSKGEEADRRFRERVASLREGKNPQ